MTLYLTRETAEALTARALREGKNSAFLARRAIGRRMKEGLPPATDAALDRLIGLRAWLERRLVN